MFETYKIQSVEPFDSIDLIVCINHNSKSYLNSEWMVYDKDEQTKMHNSDFVLYGMWEIKLSFNVFHMRINCRNVYGKLHFV